MHRQVVWLILVGIAVLPGCSMSRNALYNTVVGPLHFERYSDEFWRRVRDKNLAEEAWERAQGMAPQPYSKHYARGFKEGYVNYLTGGDGNTPLVPPRRYWSFFYQSPEGNEAIQDWFAGWRHGDAVAKESGYRHLVIIPTTLTEPLDRTERLQSDNVDPKTGEPKRQATEETAPMPKEAKPDDPSSRPTDAKPSDAKPADAAPAATPPSPRPPADAPAAKPKDGSGVKPADAPAATPPNRPTDSPKKPDDTPPPRPGGDAEEYQSLVTPKR